jgi:transcriptional regulator with XRE-family HTH domain
VVQGRKPDLKRWARVERLRKTGLSLAQIGRRLGMTAKAVHRTLRTIERARVSPRSVPCSACRRDIVSAGAIASDRGSALCLECLGRRAGIPFGRRLKAFRLAAGLTKAELVTRCGFTHSALWKYEDRGVTPRLPAALRLAQALGVSLKALGLERRPPASQAQPQRNGRPKKRQ